MTIRIETEKWSCSMWIHSFSVDFKMTHWEENRWHLSIPYIRLCVNLHRTNETTMFPRGYKNLWK